MLEALARLALGSSRAGALAVALSTGQPATAQSPGSQVPAQERRLPRPTGALPIGRTTLPLVDMTRPEVMTAEQSDRREVLLHIWYPAAARGGTPAPYMDVDPTDPAFRKDYRCPACFNSVRTNSVAEAELSSTRARYPVILFSHGLGTVSSLYSTFIENLASHGYVVVGVEHPYFASAFRFPDGRVIGKESRRPPDKIDATPEEQERLRSIREDEALIQAQDLVFVLDQLEQLNRKKEGRFGGRLDLRHIGVFGHSRGGFAAPHACFLDQRFRACLNLDGYRLTEAVMKNGIRQPYMHIQETPPWEPPLTAEQLLQAKLTPQAAHLQTVASSREWDHTFRNMKSTAYVVTVAGAKHMSFSDMPFIFPERYADIPIDARKALAASNAYITAFFGKYLRGENQALLSSRAPFPEVTLEVLQPGRSSTIVFHPQ